MSTVKIIEYRDSNAFTFDSDLVVIDANGARLKKKTLAADELILATGRAQQNADLGASLPIYEVGNAVWDALGYNCDDATGLGYFSLNDDSGRDGITPLTPTSHFDYGDYGTIRLKHTPDYVGSPAANSYVFSTGNTTFGGGLGSSMTVVHLAAGGFHVRSYDAAGVGTAFFTTPSWVAVQGQEYEIEVTINGSGGTVGGIPAFTAAIYVDGILIGSGSVKSGASTRDFFYLGNNYAAAGFTSQGSFRDVQIFNTIKHAVNFPSEIPRTVGVYPNEALIVPLEDSVAEGFISSEEDSTLPDDTSIQYLIRIKSANYWINGLGDLVVSDGTLLESNTLADWNLPANVATVTAFIAAGARVTMLPILSGGSTAMSTPDLDSNTLTYDFFAVPETCIGCTLYGWVKDNCQGIVSGTVRVYTKKPIFTQGNLVSFDETVSIEAPNGFFEIDLIRPNLISVASSTTPSVSAGTEDTYKLEATWVDIDGKAWSLKKTILIPDATSAILQSVIR